MSPRRFDPPGPGSWSLDTAHFPRPVTRFVAELYAPPARAGFCEATALYGLLLDHIAWRFVERWAYLSPRPVWATDGSGGTPATEAEWRALVTGDPAIVERLDASGRVFPERRWRDDVRSWDERIKPGMVGAHRELQAVPVGDLDGDGLLDHLARCRTNLERAVRAHHRLGVAFAIPAGDFLAWAAQEAGADDRTLLALLRHGRAPAAEELQRLGTALARDRGARRILEQDGPPERTLASLRGAPGDAGVAAGAYIDLVEWWSTGGGADVGEPCLGEMPGVLVEAIRTAAAGSGQGSAGDGAAAVRARIPAARRREFDDALAEARLAHRVRDERAIFCDVWAFGLCRRALLAAGRRLERAGRLEDASHAVEAGRDEIGSLLAGSGGPDAGELAARARYRAEASAAQPPPVLGGPPRGPVPLEWLPEGAARTERAFRTYVRAMSEADEGGRDPGGVSGMGASGGRYEGRARVVSDASELARVARGDVLVVAATTPAFNPVMPLVGAVVTNRGGLLSHAAIVAREYGIPAVVGTGDATDKIPDGAVVYVDGSAGEVTILATGEAAHAETSAPKRSR